MLIRTALFLCSLPAFAQVDPKALIRSSPITVTPALLACAVGVLKDGKFIHQQGYGYANLDYDFPLTSKSVFDIGSPPSSSLPSPFCCSKKTASSRLKIPSANTSRSFPITERPSPSITCLLTPAASAIIWHSANSPVTAPTISLPIPKWSPCSPAKNLNFKPGDEFLYSNSGYFLVSQIVVRVSGQTLPQFLEARVFEPLGMTKTHSHEDHTRIVKNRPTGYELENGKIKISMSTLDMVGDGGIYHD